MIILVTTDHVLVLVALAWSSKTLRPKFISKAIAYIRLEATDTSLLNAAKMLKKLGSGEMEKAMHESDVESTD